MNQPTKLPEVWPFPDQRAVCHLQGDKLSQAQVATPALHRPPLTDIQDAPFLGGMMKISKGNDGRYYAVFKDEDSAMNWFWLFGKVFKCRAGCFNGFYNAWRLI